MDLPLLTRVLAHVNVVTSETQILAVLIIFIHASNFEIMDKVRDKLAATKLSDFPGENVELYCDNQLVLFQKLTNAGFLQPQHLSLA